MNKKKHKNDRCAVRYSYLHTRHELTRTMRNNIRSPSIYAAVDLAVFGPKPKLYTKLDFWPKPNFGRKLVKHSTAL